MPTTAMLKGAEDLSKDFGKHMAKVMAEAEKNLVDVLAGKGGSMLDATTLLNSRPEMLEALRQAGYQDLANAHVMNYGDIPDQAAKAFAARSLPAPHFTSAHAEMFTNIARADLERFEVIGNRAMDELRLNLYRPSIAGDSFSTMVASIAKATTGTSVKGSPLTNYAYTHANTAVLSVQGQVLIAAGESIGADLWEVVGPDDEETRGVCQIAVADPTRTKEQWIAADYWGPTPGGWNCRHQFFPVLK